MLTSNNIENRGSGGRPKKKISDPNDPIYKEFLGLFGLSGWDDKKTWTRQDLVDNNSVDKYFNIRSKILELSYPLNIIRKIKVDSKLEFHPKDLVTLLNQFAHLYGYSVTSYTRDIKPTKYNGLSKKQCYQVYGLTRNAIMNEKN